MTFGSGLFGDGTFGGAGIPLPPPPSAAPATLTITRSFSDPFYTGLGGGSGGGPQTVAQIGTQYDVGIGGRGYMLDLRPEDGGNGYTVKSLPLLQRYYLTQTQGNLGEQSLNPEDYWRRSVDSWNNGSGQVANDHDQSIRTRFRSSKGIDPWTPGQFTLLHDVSNVLTSISQNLRLAVAGTYLYCLDSTVLKYTTDASTFTFVTGAGLPNAQSIASDGFSVYVADSADTYYTTRGFPNYNTYCAAPHPSSLVRSVKGRLFTANLNVVYEHTGVPGGAATTALFTHPNVDWTWVDMAEGPTAIYFAGFSGDKSIIYQTAILSDGTALNVPSAAASLPSGEIVRSIQGYLGAMMIGTDKGLRVAAIDSQGNLTVGDLIQTGSPVLCFEPQAQFVWFGLSNYDGVSTGLGRADLSTFNASSPACASDVMARTSGAVLSVETFQGVRVFTVQGSGIWIESATDRVETGTILSGALNFALPDPKTAVKFTVSYLRGGGTITASLSADDMPFAQLGGPITTNSASGSNAVLPAALLTGRTFEVELTLDRDGLDASQAPTVDRWTLLANPAPERRVRIELALMLHHEMRLRNGQTQIINPRFERDQIDAWMQSNEVITFQDSESSYAVTVNDYEWRSYAQVDAKVRSWDGTLMVTLNEIR